AGRFARCRGRQSVRPSRGADGRHRPRDRSRRAKRRALDPRGRTPGARQLRRAAGRYVRRRRRHQRHGRRSPRAGGGDRPRARFRPLSGRGRGVTSAPPPRSTLVVVADSPLAAARIEALLREASTAPVVIASPGQITTVAAEHAPCIVILSMPAPSVARALERLAITAPMPPGIVLTAPPHDAWTARARRNGVRAVLRHDAGPEELAAAIAATQTGQSADQFD